MKKKKKIYDFLKKIQQYKKKGFYDLRLKKIGFFFLKKTILEKKKKGFNN